MFKYLLLASIVLFGSIPRTSYAQSYDFQKNGIAYVWENEPNCLESKKVFLDAFVKCYGQIPLDVLRKSSREEMVQWLDDAFEGIYVDYKSSKSALWLSAKADDKIVGFLVIDMAKYPEEIYLAQLAIDPAYQGRGIASSMIRSLFDQFSECGRFVVITRCANEEAKGLYNALNFAPSSYMHEGYSRELYTGFEYINHQETVMKLVMAFPSRLCRPLSSQCIKTFRLHPCSIVLWAYQSLSWRVSSF